HGGPRHPAGAGGGAGVQVPARPAPGRGGAGAGGGRATAAGLGRGQPVSTRAGTGTADPPAVRPVAHPAALRIGPGVLAGVALHAALLAYLTKLPCRLVSWEQPGTFRQLCYSDLPTLYASRGMAEGRFPYLDASALLEYPVLQTAVA